MSSSEVPNFNSSATYGASVTPASKKKKSRTGFTKAIVSVLVLVIGVAGFGIGIQLTGKSFEGCLVNSKKVDDEGNMRVYTENCGTMKVDLDPFLGQASDQRVFDSIEENSIYDMKLKGIQVDALSLLPNIISVQKVGTVVPAS